MRCGVNVLTTQEAGMMGASDKEHLVFAMSQGGSLLLRMMTFCVCMPSASGWVGVNIHQATGIKI